MSKLKSTKAMHKTLDKAYLPFLERMVELNLAAAQTVLRIGCPNLETVSSRRQKLVVAGMACRLAEAFASITREQAIAAFGTKKELKRWLKDITL